MMFDNVLLDERLDSHTKIILASIISFCFYNRERGKSCYIRDRQLVQRTGLKTRAIQNRINFLKENDYIYLTGKGASRAIHLTDYAKYAQYYAKNDQKLRKKGSSQRKDSGRNPDKGDSTPPSESGMELPKIDDIKLAPESKTWYNPETGKWGRKK